MSPNTELAPSIEKIPIMATNDSEAGELTFDETLEFVRKVKKHYTHEPEMYSSFLSLLKNFEDQTIGLNEAKDKITALFADAPLLARGFRYLFLPAALRTSRHEEGPNRQDPMVDHAISYIDRIKEHYSHNPEVYHLFVDILEDFRNQKLGILEVLDAVYDFLAADGPEFIPGFDHFLPPGYRKEAYNLALRPKL